MALPAAAALIGPAIEAGGKMITGYLDREEQARQARLNRQSQERMANQADATKRLGLSQQMQMHKDTLGLTKANERATNAQAKAQEMSNDVRVRMMSAYGG